ncbi:hypothetical protein F2Q65_05500 [Thiohalocapsa marina]|uniref:TetR/AcrR family transcriptional regulator n=1 Tax=Thiohalocapsa marina TaxID=424902 RepID=A0A5M8FN98_9GAMM|nr:hypothetical protein [Thiohalocapsa marina]KAA6186257.1 hypothetical protein F2Q65_05500 [Thiohalocapsa marina]
MAILAKNQHAIRKRGFRIASFDIRRERMQALLRGVRRKGSRQEDTAAFTEVVMALFEGLAARAINHPALDRAALAAQLRQVLRGLL